MKNQDRIISLRIPEELYREIQELRTSLNMGEKGPYGVSTTILFAVRQYLRLLDEAAKGNEKEGK